MNEVDGDEELEGIYDPFEHPRSTREALPLPSGAEVRADIARVGRRVLDRFPDWI